MTQQKLRELPRPLKVPTKCVGRVGLWSTAAVSCLALYFLIAWTISSSESLEPDLGRKDVSETPSGGRTSKTVNIAPITSIEESEASVSIHLNPASSTGSAPVQDASHERLADLISDPDCRMLVGSPQGQSIVLLVLAEVTGSRFVAVDDTGILSQGRLPFNPHRMNLGISEFGSPLLAFSDSHTQESPPQDMSRKYRVRILRGREEAFSSESILDYGIAKDGASHFVVEPLTKDYARLVVRNFRQGNEHHFDLGQAYKPHSDGQPAYRASYSLDETEIQLVPTGQGLERAHRFFSVSDGQQRRVRVQLQTFKSRLLFPSSEVLYILAMGEDGRNASIDKYSGDEESRWALSMQWSTPLPPLSYTGHLSLAQGGEFLVAHADPAPRVLSTSSGHLVESTPLWGEPFEHLSEDVFLKVLRDMPGYSELPASGIVHRGNFAQNNNLLSVILRKDKQSFTNSVRQYRQLLLDTDALGYTGQPAQSPTPCRIADPPFAGVNAEVAKLVYQ